MAIEAAAEAPASLREVLESNIGMLEEGPADTPAPAAEQPEVAAAPSAERPRDEKGRFAPGSPEDKAEKAAAAPAVVTPPAPQRPEVPKSWKADYRPHWEKIDPQLAAYIAQREQEASEGIGKHRGEAERLRPLQAAVEPFLPDLQRHGIEPAQFITNLGNAHKTLALGTPDQKLAMFAQLAQQYQVPLQGMFVRGQDGQVYLNEQLLRQAPQPAPQVQQPEDIRKTVQEVILEQQTAREIAEFEAQADKYPHYQEVKEDMALLLQQGRATDLPNAYEKAIRLNDSIWEAEQQRKLAASQTDQRKAQDLAAKQAKAKALSPRSVTPSATSATGNSGSNKSIRGALEANAHLLDGAEARI